MAIRHDLPPVVQLLLAEDFEGVHTSGQLRRRLKPLAAELRRQAAWSESNYTYFDDLQNEGETDFLVRASGSLDPFSQTDHCRNLGCRLGAADHFARTLAVVSDGVIISDVFTSRFMADDKKADEERLISDVAVLNRLRPLIESGLVTFSDSSVEDFCPLHSPEGFDRLALIADDILAEVGSDIRYERKGQMLGVFTGSLFNPPLWHTTPLTEEAKHDLKSAALNAFAKALQRDVAAIIRDMRSAAKSRSTLVSGSQLGLLTLRRIEGNAPRLDSATGWESLRSVGIPWLDRLRVEEVVRLREEAANALPRLRASLQNKLAGQLQSGSDDSIQELVGALREDAAEVESELRALKLSKERGFRSLSGGLGLTIAVYGVAAGFVAPAVGLGTLLSLLGVLHAAGRGDEKEHERLTSRPGYVLLKAREIVSHRH
jgi:hypothetical protein